MSRLKSRFHSLYWQQFSLIAGVVLMALLLMGVSFYALSYNYLVGEKRGEMKERAQMLAQISADFLTAENAEKTEQEYTLSRMVSVASMMTEVNFLICNENGQVLLTTDASLAGRSITIPHELQQEILNSGDGFEGHTTLDDIYPMRQFAIGVPMVNSSGDVVGVVLATIDASQMVRLWKSFTGLFFMISAVVLLIAFVGSSLMSVRQIQPISEMVRGTRAYAAGDFDVRIADDEGRSDEIGELARSFNMMADSLAEDRKSVV